MADNEAIEGSAEPVQQAKIEQDPSDSQDDANKETTPAEKQETGETTGNQVPTEESRQSENKQGENESANSDAKESEQEQGVELSSEVKEVVEENAEESLHLGEVNEETKDDAVVDENELIKPKDEDETKNIDEINLPNGDLGVEQKGISPDNTEEVGNEAFQEEKGPHEGDTSEDHDGTQSENVIEQQTEGTEQTQVGGEGEGDETAKGVTETPGEASNEDGIGLTTVAEGEEGAEGEIGDELPKPSDEFTEGEEPEGPTLVGERLSQDESPVPDERLELMESPPVPGTPEDDEEEEEYEEEEEDGEEEEEEQYEEPEFDREQLIERYHQALQEREQIQNQNHQLQHKLAEYFRKKKSDDNRQDVDKNVTDQEQRYLKYMANLDELRRQDMEERESYRVAIEEYRERCEEKQERVNDERDKFMEFKKLVASNAINSRSGKPISPKDVELYMATEMRKEADVVNVRLENIKLKNKLRKKELQLKSKEELAEGLHLIDFEQLKIENQTYNEKIEERNEELLKLRKKITSTVQVLTHLKEKLQFVQAENQVLKGRLRDVEEDAAKKRDKLTRTKQSRDRLRIDNHRLRQNCGLLGNEPLLRDFEGRKDESTDLKDQLERLKMEHAELTLSCNGVRKKIDQVRAGRS